jgi:hypothetical protein
MTKQFNSELFEDLIVKEQILFLERIDLVPDENLKNALIAIFKLRLSGCLPKFFSFDSGNYDWVYNISPELVEHLEDFNSYYFSPNHLEGLGPGLNTMISQVVNDIIGSSENIKLIAEKIECTEPKELLIALYKYGNLFSDSKKKLEYTFIVSRISKFMDFIEMVFPNISRLQFVNDLKNVIGFDDFILSVTSTINATLRNSIKSIISVNSNLSSSERDVMCSLLFKTEKHINTLFWIVYSHDVKYIDTIITSCLSNDYMVKLEHKLESCGPELIDQYEKIIESTDMIKNKFLASLNEKIISRLDELTDSELIAMMDDEINKIMMEITDPFEICFYSNVLDETKSIMKLTFTMDKFAKVLQGSSK